MLQIMFFQAIRRGASDTWLFARTRIVTSIAYVIGVFITASVVRYSLFGREMMIGEWEVAFSGLIGVLIFLLVALLWNIACGPYRIKRDRVRELESQITVDEGVTTSLPLTLDWAMKDLILHIDPFVFRDESDAGLDPLRGTERKIADQASIGNLHIWGRKFDQTGMDKLMGISHPLILIPKERWAEFYFTHHAIFDDRVSDEAQVAPIDHCTGPLFTDLRVSSSQAKQLWPKISDITGARIEVTVSMQGIHKVYFKANSHIERVSHENPLPARQITIHFKRPMPRRYSVTVESSGTVFKSVPAESPHSCTINLQGQTIDQYIAAVAFSLLDEAWGPELPQGTEAETPP